MNRYRKWFFFFWQWHFSYMPLLAQQQHVKYSSELMPYNVTLKHRCCILSPWAAVTLLKNEVRLVSSLLVVSYLTLGLHEWFEQIIIRAYICRDAKPKLNFWLWRQVERYTRTLLVSVLINGTVWNVSSLHSQELGKFV